MEEEEIKEMRDFSLAALLLVTGFCFLLFTWIIKFLEGLFIQAFLWIGLTTFILGLLAGAVILIARNKG
jgi:hypothetical protein